MKQTITDCLGQVIRELRIEAGFNQVEFSERSGFYQTYLSRIENGQANPTINAIEVIAETLGLNIFDLFDMAKNRLHSSTDALPKRLSRHKPA